VLAGLMDAVGPSSAWPGLPAQSMATDYPRVSGQRRTSVATMNWARDCGTYLVGLSVLQAGVCAAWRCWPGRRAKSLVG
jgi:hypothetical protein